VTLATAIAAAGVTAIGSTDDTKQRRGCSAIEGRLLVLTKTGRITSVRGDGFRSWYACENRRGRRVLLDDHDPGGGNYLAMPRFAGSFAAFARSSPSIGGAGRSGVLVNVATRRRASVGAPGPVTDLVLSSLGELVLLTPGARAPGEVIRLSLRGASVLDSGAVEPGSLALSSNGRFVYWQNAGQPRRFDLSDSSR
jgi:hypothetical protein